MISPEEKQAVIDLFPFMGENPVVFDVGSNKGHWADIILEEHKEKPCSLYLFEPNPKLLSFTEVKYEYNKNVKRFECVAAYKSLDDIKLYYFENYNNELSSIYRAGDEWKGLPMKERVATTVTIDRYCGVMNIEKVDYIKIDTEGSDVDVLVGCENMLKNEAIGITQIEYSEHWQRGNHTWDELKSIADKYGYKIYRYIDGNFWEEKSEAPEYDNYFLTKYEIHNYSVGGWNNSFILNTCDLPKMNLIGEWGAFEGLTTKYICENLLDESGRVIVIDPLNDYYVVDDPRYHPEFKHQYQRFVRNTRGLPVELKKGKTEDELPLLHHLRFDLIFVDSNHYSPWPYWDGCWSFAVTKIGGRIIFDDYNLWAQETKDSIDKFLNEFRNSLEIEISNYQVRIKKVANQYNELTYEYYK